MSGVQQAGGGGSREGVAVQTCGRGANLPRSSWPPDRRSPRGPGASAGGCRSYSRSQSGSPRGTVRRRPARSVGVASEGASQGASEARVRRGGRGAAASARRRHRRRGGERGQSGSKRGVLRIAADLRRDLLVVGHPGVLRPRRGQSGDAMGEPGHFSFELVGRRV